VIRVPTPLAVQLAWHRATLAGMRPERYEDVPEAGWYKRRAVKDGPWLPVRVWIEQDIDPISGELLAPERFRASCLGESVDPARMWTYLRPISRDEYDALVRLHRDLDAMAATHAPIDLSTTILTPQRSLS